MSSSEGEEERNFVENEAEEEKEENEENENEENERSGEEEEEGPDDYIRDGFVVDEIEEDTHEKKKRKKRKRRENENLEEDDFFLLKEAGVAIPMGREPSKKFKRIQQKPNTKELLRGKLFEGPEVDEDEEDRFIEENFDEDESFGEEDEFIADNYERSYRRNRFEDSKMFEDEMDQEDIGEKRVVRIEESFEPQELEENFLGKEDKDIQSIDKPERLQLRDRKLPKYEKRYHYCPSNRRSIFPVTVEQKDGTKVEKEVSIFTVSELKESLEVDSEHYLLLYVDNIKTFSPLQRDEDLFQIKDGSILKIVVEDDYDHYTKLSNEKKSDLDLKNEAEWIYRSVFEGNLDNSTFSSTVSKIVYILKFLKRDHFEIPFIYTYRKDYYTPDLDLSDLWEIYDWDEKWEHLQYRKSLLYQKYLQARVPEEYFGLLEESSKETEIQDLYDHFLVHYGSTIEQAQKRKRAQKRDIYSICKKNGLLELTKRFGLSASQLGQNMSQSNMIHFPNTSDALPEDLASEYTTKTEYKTIESVLSAVRSALAQEIALDPRVRASIRPLYERNIAGVFTSPTPKGIKEIDAFHPYRIVLNIVNKPPEAFNTTQFLTILKASKEGYITFKIDYSKEGYEDNLREMENLYLAYSDESDEIGKIWNEQRKLILSEALTKYLYPQFQKELIHSLTEQAKERVTLAASKQFTKLLMQGPFQPSGSNSRTSLNEVIVMACVVGTGREPSYCVVLDPEGMPKAQLKLNNVDKERDVLLNFLRHHSPHVVAIGASWEANRLYSIIGKEKASDSVHVTYVNTEIARIFQNSARAKAEFPELPPEVRQSICLGRYLQDPLTELAGLCAANEASCINLHSYQSMVGTEQLNYALQKCAINVTNSVGVDINRVVRYKHASGLLQFVSGFGPRKAIDLIQKIQRRGGNISSREELEQWIRSSVFTNCAGFLKILNKYAIHEWTPLDNTRIHPEDYLLVEKMAKDALETNKKKIVRLMHEPRKLDDVDLDEFAEELKRKGRPKKKSTLYDIKKEVNHPFADSREFYRDPSPEELFFYFTGEGKENFIEGQLVSARIVMVGDKELRCRLELGVPSVIHLENASDERFESFSDIGVNPGDTLACRLKKLKISAERLEAELTCRSSDLQSDVYEREHLNFLKEQESYLQDLDPRLLNPDQNKLKKSRPMTRKIVQRQVDHPLFSNLTFQTAEQHLNDQEIGEIVIRPSSKGINFLNITWKFYDDMFVHITIREEDKPNPHSLGKTLYIDNEKFDDLDEIISRYIEPMNQYVKDMVNSRRFNSGSLDQITATLTEEKQANKTRIPYCLTFDHEHSGKFLIAYIPRQSVKKESINVTPTGFRFRGKLYPNPEKLIDWFKRHWKDVPKPRPSSSSSSSRPNPIPSSSSFVNEPPSLPPKTVYNPPVPSSSHWGNPSSKPSSRSNQPTQAESWTSGGWEGSWTNEAPSQEKAPSSGWGNSSSGSGWGNSSNSSSNTWGSSSSSIPPSNPSSSWGSSSNSSSSWGAPPSNPAPPVSYSSNPSSNWGSRSSQGGWRNNPNPPPTSGSTNWGNSNPLPPTNSSGWGNSSSSNSSGWGNPSSQPVNNNNSSGWGNSSSSSSSGWGNSSSGWK